MNLWDDVLAKVESKVNRHSFATWFRPTTSLGLQGSTLHVRVPNSQFKDWLAKNYQGVIAEALDELGRTEVRVLFDCEPETSAERGILLAGQNRAAEARTIAHRTTTATEFRLVRPYVPSS